MSTKTNIYILKLKSGKYYIGQSNNLEKRREAHMNGTASAWTKKYKPVSVEKIIPNSSYFDEDKWTKEYMDKHGISNVRGGSYTEIELSEFQVDTLKVEIWGAKGLCKTCGRPGHFAKNCYAKNDVHGNPIEYEDDSDEESDEWGCEYCERTFTTKYGCTVHERSCKKTYEEEEEEYDDEPAAKGNCYKCGRPGHYSPDCYAKRHVNGYPL